VLLCPFAGTGQKRSHLFTPFRIDHGQQSILECFLTASRTGQRALYPTQLGGHQLAVQVFPPRREKKQPLTAIKRALFLSNIAPFDQFTQYPSQRLLGNF
jgi:hypothetical protein